MFLAAKWSVQGGLLHVILLLSLLDLLLIVVEVIESLFRITVNIDGVTEYCPVAIEMA